MIKLSINQMELMLNLGFGAEERSTKQSILIDFDIYLKSLPQSCLDDDINGTYCYFDLTQKIQALCINREFKLIEYLCNEIFILLEKNLTHNLAKLSVTISKNPPINNVNKASFTISKDY
jgi:dihydroneopterin aldolase